MSFNFDGVISSIAAGEQQEIIVKPNAKFLRVSNLGGGENGVSSVNNEMILLVACKGTVYEVMLHENLTFDVAGLDRVDIALIHGRSEGVTCKLIVQQFTSFPDMLPIIKPKLHK